MKKAKKIFSLLLTIILMATTSIMPVEALASSKPKATSISSISAVSCGFTVKYKKVTKITGYQVQYSTSSKFSNAKSVKVSKASTTSKTVKNLTANKKYYVRVRTYKSVKKNNKTTNSYSSWSNKKSVTTKPKATSVTSISAISCGFKVSYKEVKSSTGYQIQYSTSSDFSNAKSVKVTKASTTSKTVKNLKANKKYYVRVRTYKSVKKDNKTTTSYSPWSKTKTIKTKAKTSSKNDTTIADVIKNTDLKTPEEIAALTIPPEGCVPTTGRTWNELFADPVYCSRATLLYTNRGETNPNARVDDSITNNTNIATIPGTGNIAPAYVFPNYGKNCAKHNWMYVVTKNNGDMVFYETHDSAIQGTYCAECGYDGLTDTMRATKCYNELDMGILQSDRTRNVAVHRMDKGHTRTACNKTLMEIDCNVYRHLQTVNKSVYCYDTHNYQFTRYCVNCGKWEIVLNNFQEITDCHGAAYDDTGKAVVIL